MAIVRDTQTGQASSGDVTSLTYSHTCTGSNLILWVGTAQNVDNGTDHITGVTYNSVAMSAKGNTNSNGGSHRSKLWVLLGPATGANNIVITSNNTTGITGLAVSYTGVKQSQTIPEGSLNNNTGTSITSSVTTVVNNSAVIMLASNNVGVSHTAGTNANVVLGTIGPADTFHRGNTILESSPLAVSPAGSFSMTGNISPSASNATIMSYFEPDAVAAANRRRAFPLWLN